MGFLLWKIFVLLEQRFSRFPENLAKEIPKIPELGFEVSFILKTEFQSIKILPKNLTNIPKLKMPCLLRDV